MAEPAGARNQRHQAKEGLDAILSPRSIAVIGASPRAEAIGHAILKSILDGGYRGQVFPVHPSAQSVLGLPAFRTIEEIPTPVDLAVVAVPAPAVLEVATACGRKGVRGLLVISAGFREVDDDGARREAALAAVVARYGMRMVGPNCLGVANASPSVRLNATFGSRPLAPGTTAIVTQSGAVGIALMEHAAHVGLGLSRFVSMGNKTDVSGNDLLLLWEDDPEVRQVLMYLENFGNPRNFVRIARRITRTKPIVVVKSGRTATGARAAGSHTGALTQSDAVVDALLEQCGVMRAQSVEEMFDIAALLAAHSSMGGPRVAIVTNSGGPAILAVDRLEAAGLRLAEFAPATTAVLQTDIPPESHATNPLDLLAGGTPQAFEGALDAAMADTGVDAVIAIWTPLEEGQTAQAEAIARAFSRGGKPGVAVLFGHGPATPAFRALRAAGVPAYTFPENAVGSLAALRKATAWREQAVQEAPPFSREQAAGRAVLDGARPGPDGWLTMRDSLRLLAAYGIPLPRHAWLAAASEAPAAAKETGFPAVLKVEAAGLVHKTEAGAVRLGLAGAADVASAFAAASQAVADHGFSPSGALLMAAAPAGPELLVGATQDPLFGPVVACGAGGIYTEFLRDVQLRLAPLSVADAGQMVMKLRVSALLQGARGQPPGDLAALHDVVVRIGQLAADFPEVAEVEANPVRVYTRGAVALDARVRLAPLPAVRSVE